MAISTRRQAAAKVGEAAALPGLPAIRRGGRIGDRERRFFTEQMALLLETGTPLQQSLRALKKQLSNPAMIALVEQLADDIAQGQQFSAALARHPEVFSTTYVSLVAASEDGGFMHEVLQQLLALDEKSEQLKQTLVSALSYPLFLMVFAFAVVVFVLVVVFPKFADLFTQIQDQLPLSTQILMSGSELLRRHWIEICAATAAAVIGFRLWAASAGSPCRWCAPSTRRCTWSTCCACCRCRSATASA